MKINSELLAAYAEGNVTETERDAVRKYLADNPLELETMLTMMDNDYELDLDERSIKTFKDIIDRPGLDDMSSFHKRLGDLLDELESEKADITSDVSILPITSKAAQNLSDNSCAVKCEGYALRALGIDISDSELEENAEKQGLLKSDGTALYNIGQLSAQYGLYVSRKYACTINDILKSLKHGDVVIAVIDNTELSLDPLEAELFDRMHGELPNHALIIKAIDVDHNNITLLNPGETESYSNYPLDVFMEAWDDSANYLIISNRNHYKPHPVDLSDISLNDDIMQLQDVFAENVHEIWAQTRIEEGWKYGPLFDSNEKKDPNLVPFDLLSKREKEHCRQMALESIKLMKKLGWSIKNNKM